MRMTAPISYQELAERVTEQIEKALLRIKIGKV